jgi:hypothetical protein
MDDPRRHGTADEADAGFAGQAAFDGCVIVGSVAAADVARLLPPPLVLRPAPASAPGSHPVIFVLGEQTDGTWLFGGLSFPLGTRYTEVALLVPHVVPRDGEPVVFVPGMRSAYFPAAWHGNAHYGFAKAPGAVRREGALLVVTDGEGRLVLHAALEARGAWLPGTFDLPAVHAVRALLAAPVVGRLADGRLVRSWFDWSFEQALVRRADARVQLEPGALGGLPGGDVPDVPDGSFEVRGMRWRLGWPAPMAP